MSKPNTEDWETNRHRYARLDNIIVCMELNSYSTSVCDSTHTPCCDMIPWYLFCAIERIRELENKLELPEDQRTVGKHLKKKFEEGWVEPDPDDEDEDTEAAKPKTLWRFDFVMDEYIGLNRIAPDGWMRNIDNLCTIELNPLSPEKVSVALTVHTTEATQTVHADKPTENIVSFKRLIRFVNEEGSKPLTRYFNLAHYPARTQVILGEFHKEDGKWQFEAAPERAG